MDDYRRGGHTRYSLKAHIIFVTKYRRRIFDREPEDRSIKELMYLAAENYGLDIIRIETDGDHIHMLIDFRPNMALKKYRNNLVILPSDEYYKRNKSGN